MRSTQYIEDRLAGIALPTIRDHLRARGWVTVPHPNDALLVFGGRQDDDGETIDIVLPVDDTSRTYRHQLAEVIELLSFMEGVSTDEVIRQVLLAARTIDRLRVRLLGPDHADPTPLLASASGLIAKIKRFLQFAAQVESVPRRMHGRLTENAEVAAFGQRVRLGHTYPGSYGISIDVPIPREGARADLAFTRRVMIRVARGLHHLHIAMEADDAGLLTALYEAGMNGNMCRELSETKEYATGLDVEYAVEFSADADIEDELRGAPPVRLDRAAYDFLGDAHKIAKSHSEEPIPEEITVSGPLHIVHRTASGLRKEGDTEVAEIGVVRVHDSATRQNVDAVLSSAHFKGAAYAMGDERVVSITGRPRMERGRRKLFDVSDFTVVGDEAPDSLQGTF